MIKIFIQNGNTIYMPSLEGRIKLSLERKNSPGKLEFTVIHDPDMHFEEGNSVKLLADNQPVFFGFVFSKRRNKEQLIEIAAYDQLRYLKNQTSYVYKNKTATGLIEMFARDFGLNLGVLEETEVPLPSRVDDGELFDAIQTALDLTLLSSGKLYVLYDDFGKLTLKNIENMKLNILIDAETAENFEYETSIDESTYNRIKLVCDNKTTGKREVYIAQDSENIRNWGTLQYYEKVADGRNITQKVNGLLRLHDKKSRKLSINGVFGDLRVRGGSSLPVQLDLGDLKVANFMVVEEVAHNFENSAHTMDLRLIGDNFYG